MVFLHLRHLHRDCGDHIPNLNKNPHPPEYHRRRRDMRQSALARLSAIYSRVDRLGIMRHGSGSWMRGISSHGCSWISRIIKGLGLFDFVQIPN